MIIILIAKYIINPFGRKKEHSFLNIDLLTNTNVSGKSEGIWGKNIPSTITTSIVSELFKTLASLMCP